MIPLCNEMMTKSRALLNIWEPSLVEEAFQFIEEHRIVDDNSAQLSPFKKITRQICALDLKSPELETFATPLESAPDVWPDQNKKAPEEHGKLKTRPDNYLRQFIHNLESLIQTVLIPTFCR